MKKIAPILGAVLVIALFFGYQKFMGGGGGPVETPVAAQVRLDKEATTEKKKRLKDLVRGHIYSVGEPFIVTLPDAERHFVKFSADLLVDVDTPIVAAAGHGGGDVVPLEEQPEIRDIIITESSKFGYEQMKAVEEREKLKEAIVEAINTETHHTVVLEVFFTDFAVQ